MWVHAYVRKGGEEYQCPWGYCRVLGFNTGTGVRERCVAELTVGDVACPVECVMREIFCVWRRALPLHVKAERSTKRISTLRACLKSTVLGRVLNWLACEVGVRLCGSNPVCASEAAKLWLPR